MTRSLRKMPTPRGIGAGQTAACNLILGSTYEILYIRMRVDDGGVADVAPANWGDYLGEIRILKDGDTVYQIDAADLVKLNTYYGQAMKPGVLPIFLSRPWMRTIGGEDETSYKTNGGVSTLDVEMDIKAGVTIDLLDVYAHQTPGIDAANQRRAWGTHLRLQKFVHNQGVVGEAQIADIPRGAYNMLAMHINTTAVTDVEILADNRKQIESDAALRAAIYDIPKRTPQAGFTHIDFLTENRLVEAMPMALADFRLKLDFTATGSFAIYAESIRGAAG